ncbi:hypothetical protein KJ830_11100 [bacterium]|nr:hypothetical protein [bacterium]
MKKNIVDNAKIMIMIAQEDFMFSPDDDQEPRFIQAFLLQSCIIEGLIREFTNDLNKKNRINGIKQPKTFNQSCRESRVVGGISKNNFDKLLSYIDFRNNLVHRLLEKDDLVLLESEINQKYVEGSDIINILI